MLSEASILQSNHGADAVPSVSHLVTVTLPNPVQDGSAVLLLTMRIGSSVLGIVADGFMADFPQVALGSNGVMQSQHRDGVDAEQSWDLDAQLGGTGHAIFWYLYELSFVDRVSPAAQFATATGLNTQTQSTGTTPQVDDTDFVLFAIHLTTSALVTIDPTTAGFVKGEEDAATFGSTNATAMVSRAYPGASGTYSCVGDYGQVVGNAGGVIVAYRAGEEIDFTLGGGIVDAGGG